MMTPSFLSLPKNSFGRVPPHAAGHILCVYFAKEHGWHLSGAAWHSTVSGGGQVLKWVILREVISNISSSTVDAPRAVPSHLQQRLHSVAATNGGQVALHGRLFLQWLHFAFPYECPFPNLPEEMEAGLKNLKSGEKKVLVDGDGER